MCLSSLFSVAVASGCDSRQSLKIRHTLPEIWFLVLCATISCCDTWKEMEEYGADKISLLRNFLPYKYGIPSDNTLSRFFSAFDPEGLRKCFSALLSSFFPEAGGLFVAIDGKTSRGSGASGKSALHTVTAFASEARLVLAQVATDKKSNELTAIPKLLDLLGLREPSFP